MFFLSLSIYLTFLSFPYFFLFLLFFLYFFFFLLTSYLYCYSFYFSLLSVFHFYFFFLVLFSIICYLFPGNQIRLKSADACSAVVVSLRSYVHHNWSYYPTIIFISYWLFLFHYLHSFILSFYNRLRYSLQHYFVFILFHSILYNAF